MQALVYHGPGHKRVEDRAKPTIPGPGDAIVRITRATICGTGLHILKGDVATCKPRTVLGHVAAGGTIANVGVHGIAAELHLEKLWSQNVTITRRLVDTVTTPMLLKTVRSDRIDANQLITHRFKFDKILDAYDTFGPAADTKALKVIIEA